MGKPPSDIFGALISRTPYVILASSIIAACYGIVHSLISEIVRINRQKLGLNKISIIATDISKSSEIDLHSLDDEEIYEKRAQLKMQMLREHLKTDIPDDFKVNLPKLRSLKRPVVIRVRTH